MLAYTLTQALDLALGLFMIGLMDQADSFSQTIETWAEPLGFSLLGEWTYEVDPLHRQFVEYLASKRGAFGMIRKSDLDPLEMKAFLPGILIIEQHQGCWDGRETRYKYRLAGTRHRNFNDMEVTGKWFDEVQPDPLISGFESDFAEILTVGGAHYKRARNTAAEKTFQIFERVLCAISLDGQRNTLLVGHYIWT